LGNGGASEGLIGNAVNPQITECSADVDVTANITGMGIKAAGLIGITSGVPQELASIG